jgi:hypothetical protein
LLQKGIEGDGNGRVKYGGSWLTTKYYLQQANTKVHAAAQRVIPFQEIPTTDLDGFVPTHVDLSDSIHVDSSNPTQHTCAHMCMCAIFCSVHRLLICFSLMICDRFYNDHFICLTHRYMAPATDALPLYPPSHSIMSATTNRSTGTTFTTLSLGRSANAIALLVPTAPPVHDPADLKACCFNYLANLLLEHAPLYSSAELIAAFNHIPSSTYNAVI